MRVENAEAGHGLLEGANRWSVVLRLSVDVGSGSIVGMNFERGGIPGVAHGQWKVELQFADARGAVRRGIGAGNVGHDGAILLNFCSVAVCGRRGRTDKVIALIWREDEQGVAFVNPGFFQVLEEGSEGSVVIGQLLGIADLARTERAFG